MIEQYDLSFLNLSSIENKLLNIHTNTHGLLTKGVSSFNVDAPLFSYSEFKGLCVIIEQYVKSYCKKQNIPVPLLINSWYNITLPGSELKTHNHGAEGLSGALYISVGKRSVPLVFSDTKIQPWPGLLIIFPSHLDHHTQKEKERRVVISFNLDY